MAYIFPLVMFHLSIRTGQFYAPLLMALVVFCLSKVFLMPPFIYGHVTWRIGTSKKRNVWNSNAKNRDKLLLSMLIAMAVYQDESHVLQCEIMWLP